MLHSYFLKVSVKSRPMRRYDPLTYYGFVLLLRDFMMCDAADEGFRVYRVEYSGYVSLLPPIASRHLIFSRWMGLLAY